MFMWLAREVLQNSRAGDTYKLIELLFSLCIAIAIVNLLASNFRD